MEKFEVNKKYFARSICDSDCIFKFEILNRTEKTVTIKENYIHSKPIRKKIYFDDSGAEYILPLGDYSFAPILRPRNVL